MGFQGLQSTEISEIYFLQGMINKKTNSEPHAEA